MMCTGFLILFLLFESFVNVKSHCPATVKNRVLAGFKFRTLLDTDWLGCILACSNHPKCYSYNFCYTKKKDLGFCDLNGCWIRENKLGEALLYAPDCYFQQLPKKTEDFPVCQRREQQKQQPRWIKANKSPVCLKTISNVQVLMPAGGEMIGLKLTHNKGRITCRKDDTECAGKWGCSCCVRCTTMRRHTNRRLDIIVTDASRGNHIFPSKYSASDQGFWYTIPHQTNENTNLTFPNLTVPLSVKRGDPLIFWYSGHLLDGGPAWGSYSSGEVCFDVRILYSEVKN